MSRQKLEALIDDAFWEGSSGQIIRLLDETPENNCYLEIVAQKILDSLHSYLASLDENEAIVKNILKILTDVLPFFKDNPEQSTAIAECMLRIASEENANVNILRCAVFNLNVVLNDGRVLSWLRSDEALEGFLLILGRKLPTVGDFECQSHIFETLCYIIYNNESKHKWIQSWFTDDEKTRSMFSNWDLGHFTVESRKIINQINRRELNPRTYAYVATSVYFGNVQMEKLNGLELWIDFNYDSKSISFFCKDFEVEDQDSGESWETVVIPTESVESYSVQKKEVTKSVELCIILNCSCSSLLLSATPNLQSTNLIRMNFWIYVDIRSHLKVIFGEPGTFANDHVLSSQGSQRTQKVSHSIDVFGVQDQDDAGAKKNRKISASEIIQTRDYYEKNGRRISDSAELIDLSDNSHLTKTENKSHNSSQKRKASSCSLFLKESDSERSFQMSGKSKPPRFKFGQTKSAEKHSINNENLINKDDEKDENRHSHKGSSSQIFRPERKSSEASFAIDYQSDDSHNLIIETDDGGERFEEMSESILKEKGRISGGKHFDDAQTISKGFVENENMNSTEEISRIKFQKLAQDVEIEEPISHGSKKLAQSPKPEADLSFKDSQMIRNSNESVKLSQRNKASISSEGSQSSQKRTKKVDSSSKISQEVSDKNGENGLSENNFLEKEQIEDQDVKLGKQGASENDLRISNKNATKSEQRNKRLKKNSDEVDKRKSSNCVRLSKRKPYDTEKEIISDETPPKKRRKAAIKAMERNKTMFQQKELGTTEGLSEKSTNLNHSNDEIEVFCTPPTKPVKKKRLKSIFLTDTETGSSNVSWIGGRNSCLFETPEKRYSKRMKSNQASKSSSTKKKTSKSRIRNSKRKQNSNFSMMNGFEIKSKSGLSDLENYELVVERKKDHKKSNHKHFSFEDVSKAINAAMEGITNIQHSDDELDKEPDNSNISSQMHNNILELDYDENHHEDESKIKDFTTTEENIRLESNDEQSMVQRKPKSQSLSSKASRSRIAQNFNNEREGSSNLNVHQKSESFELPPSNSRRGRKSAISVQKRKTDNHSTLKEKTKRNRRGSNNLHDMILDSITYTADDFGAQNLTTHSETAQNIPSDQISEPFEVLEKGKASLSSTSKRATEIPLNPFQKVAVLTEQSLSSLGSENDEAAGKNFHLERYFKDLPDKPSSPNHFEYPDKLDQAVTSQSSKRSQSNLSSRSGNLLEYSVSEKPLPEEIKISEQSIAKKKHYTSFEESSERSKVSSEKYLQKFPLLGNQSDSGLQDSFERYRAEDYHQKVSKIHGKKPTKQLSILHNLGVATDYMTHKLLKTLQKHFHNFNVKLAASREKMLATANALASKENNWNHKNLKDIAKAYKMNRIQAEKSLHQILLVGEEYFEAEKKLDHKMRRLHKKALKKYAAKIKLAGRYAVNSLEDRAAAKTEMLLKSILKKIEYL